MSETLYEHRRKGSVVKADKKVLVANEYQLGGRRWKANSTNKTTMIMKIISLLFLLIGMVGCTSVSPINDRPLNITRIGTELDPILFVYDYYDSLAPKFGWNNPPRIWRDKFEDGSDDISACRVYFLDTPGIQEMYKVAFVQNMIITSVYTEEYPVWRNGNEVGDEEKERIKQRFKRDILDKMEQFAIKSKLPDSIVYVRRSWEVK